MCGITCIEWEEEYGLVEPLVSIPFLACSINIYRSRLQPSVSTPGSNDPVGMFQGASVWLCNMCMCEVSVSVHLHSINVCRCDFGPPTSMFGSMDPIEMFQGVSEWLDGVSTL